MKKFETVDDLKKVFVFDKGHGVSSKSPKRNKKFYLGFVNLTKEKSTKGSGEETQENSNTYGGIFIGVVSDET